MMQKLLFIFYDSGIDEDLVDLFERCELEGYTRMFDAYGKGHSGKRFGDPVFPGTVNVALVAMPEERIPTLLDGLRQLEAQFRLKPPIRVFAVGTEIVY
jgi:hypothetical protein